MPKRGCCGNEMVWCDIWLYLNECIKVAVSLNFEIVKYANLRRGQRTCVSKRGGGGRDALVSNVWVTHPPHHYKCPPDPPDKHFQIRAFACGIHLLEVSTRTLRRRLPHNNGSVRPAPWADTSNNEPRVVKLCMESVRPTPFGGHLLSNYYTMRNHFV